MRLALLGEKKMLKKLIASLVLVAAMSIVSVAAKADMMHDHMHERMMMKHHRMMMMHHRHHMMMHKHMMHHDM